MGTTGRETGRGCWLCWQGHVGGDTGLDQVSLVRPWPLPRDFLFLISYTNLQSRRMLSPRSPPHLPPRLASRLVRRRVALVPARARRVDTRVTAALEFLPLQQVLLDLPWRAGGEGVDGESREDRTQHLAAQLAECLVCGSLVSLQCGCLSVASVPPIPRSDSSPPVHPLL